MAEPLNCDGFILTRQWRDTSKGVALEFWCASEQGAVRATVSKQEAVFFLSQQDFSEARRLLGDRFCVRSRRVEMETFTRQPAIACYFLRQRELIHARNQLQAAGISVLEADIKPSDRFLMERFITGGVKLVGPVQTGACHIEFSEPRLQRSDYLPTLKVLSLDIETAIDSPTLYSIGLYTDNEQCVLMVGQGDDDELVRYFADESSLLLGFFHWLEQTDPDVIIGWNVINFDLWFLEKCCQRLGLKLILGRHEGKAHWRDTDDSGDRKAISIAGRVVIDGIDVLRTAGYHFESFSLQAVASQLLGEGKLLTGGQRGSEITDLYRQDKRALAEYNITDCRLVMDIFTQQGLIDFSIARAVLTGLPLDRVGGSVAAFDFQYLPLLHRAGFVAPAGSDQPMTASPGGYVMSSRPGVYNHVLVLDFKSLYPSIIRSYCIDPMGMAIALCNTDEDYQLVPGFSGGRFSRTEHLLPEIIAGLWKARDGAKARGDKALSQAIKIIMNSFYGVLGTPGCRFFDPRLASSITRRGHQILTESKTFIEQQGYRVIYGDTDSVFVWVENCDSHEQAQQVGVQLAAQLNTWW
ncbi:MAG: DNA polymerase II, partial [Pseudomonadales bacterium]